jgi:hypothetical protein
MKVSRRRRERRKRRVEGVETELVSERGAEFDEMGGWVEVDDGEVVMADRW